MKSANTSSEKGSFTIGQLEAHANKMWDDHDKQVEACVELKTGEKAHVLFDLMFDLGLLDFLHEEYPGVSEKMFNFVWKKAEEERKNKK